MTTAAIASRHKTFARVTFDKGSDGTLDEGAVVARFSTFDIPDREGDIVRSSAFKNGQSLPMVWAHQWDKPIGKGIVRVMRDHAQFLGGFFDTAAGQEARAAVKAMGSLQQWSFGFKVLETRPNSNIRGIDIVAAELFEVSPVLVGANPQTGTLSVKGRTPARYVPMTALERARYRLALEQLDLERVALR